MIHFKQHLFISIFSVWPILSPNQKDVFFLKIWISVSWRQRLYQCMGILQIQYCTKNILYTKMIRIHVFSIFTIKSPRALAADASLGLLILKTLKHVLLTITHWFTYTLYGKLLCWPKNEMYNKIMLNNDYILRPINVQHVPRISLSALGCSYFLIASSKHFRVKQHE